jgi:hypothetical protein
VELASPEFVFPQDQSKSGIISLCVVSTALPLIPSIFRKELSDAKTVGPCLAQRQTKLIQTSHFPHEESRREECAD